MKITCFLVVWLGLGGLFALAAGPLTAPEALQILKDYYAQEKEWWVDMGLIFPLSEGATVRKKLLESQKQTIGEYLYSHYKNLKPLEENSLVNVIIEEDNDSKVSRYKYTVQPTDKLLQSTPCRQLPGVWHIATFDQIEVLRVEQVGVIKVNGPSSSVSVTYIYRLKPSMLGRAIGLSEKTAQGACEFFQDGKIWRVDTSLQPRQIFNNPKSK